MEKDAVCASSALVYVLYSTVLHVLRSSSNMQQMLLYKLLSLSLSLLTERYIQTNITEEGGGNSYSTTNTSVEQAKPPSLSPTQTFSYVSLSLPPTSKKGLTTVAKAKLFLPQTAYLESSNINLAVLFTYSIEQSKKGALKFFSHSRCQHFQERGSFQSG